MTDIAQINNENLPSLIDRASTALASAKTSAEVLEARDAASIAYDAAKTAGRIAKAKKAHDDVLSAVYRAQADALLIEARAKVRLADEYDAAQERGEVGQSGARKDLVSDGNEVAPSADDIGLSRKQIHEARKIRDAEQADPGKAERALDEMVERGEEPTKAKLRREIEGGEKSLEPVEPARPKSPYADLTREALEDDLLGLAEANAELQKAIDERDHTIEQLQEQIKDLSADNQGAVISKMQRQRQTLKASLDKAMLATKREEYKRKQAERERDEAISKLENQLISI